MGAVMVERAVWSCLRAMSWAKYLRKVDIAFCPFTPSATPAVWLKEVSTRKVAAISPKLQVSKQLLPRATDPATATTQITYADGSKQEFELTAMQVRDILEEIEMTNVRISQAEAERGKPFS